MAVAGQYLFSAREPGVSWFAVKWPPMSALSIFLRLFLCIGLVLNGSGVAVAATQMQLGHPHLEHQATMPVAAVSEPCHEMAGMEALATQQLPAAGNDGTRAPATLAGSPADCCDSSGCDCSCAQHVQVATTHPSAPSATAVSSTAASRMTTGHTSPALPHLIRPPIG